MSQKRQTKFTPGWYKISGTQTLAANGSVSFNFNSLTQLISAAKTAGMRGSVHAISVVASYSGTLAASGAGQDWYCADIQRGCYLTMNLNTPNTLAKYYEGDVPLSLVRHTGKIQNPAVVALDRLLPVKRRQLHRFDTVDPASANYNLNVNYPNLDKRISLIDGNGDDENIQKISSAAGEAFDFSDVFTHPLCQFSGGANPFYYDKLPLTMVGDSNCPWIVTISERQIAASTIRTGLFKPNGGGVTIDIECWIYCSFTPVTSDHAVGCLWSSIPQPFSGSDKVVDSHYYRTLASFPDYGSSQKDNGINTPYKPDNWQTFLQSGNARVFDCGGQVFPLIQYSEAWRSVDHWNCGNGPGSNPLLLWDFNSSNTTNVSFGSSLAGTVDAKYSADMLGMWTNMFIFPFITNHFALKGFPINVMYKPGCSNNIKIQVDGASLPSGAADRTRGIYIGEYDADRNTAMNYSLYGLQNPPSPNMNNDAWVPAIENLDSGSAPTAKDIVPYVLKV